MAFRVVRGNPSNEGWKATVNRHGCGDVIGLLRARDAQGGTICKNNLWRIDGQNTDGTQMNLQVQRNGIWNEKSSVGGVLFSAALVGRIGQINATGPAGATATARDHELTSALHKALTDSVGTWAVTGPPANRVASFVFFKIEGDFSS